MRVYVTGSSALHFWRHDPIARDVLARFVPDPLSDCPVTPEEVRSAGLSSMAFGPAPLHLVAPSRELRISRRSYRYSVCSRFLPETAFRQAGEHLCVASPEYCLLQSAHVLSRIRLIELCMELCGKYALAKEASRGFISRNYQLASVASASAFLKNMKGSSCVAALGDALRYVQDGSRSPMETREYLLMCLPKRMGGYALPKPLINMRVELTVEERRIAKRQHLECDLCWPEQKVVVEYDGQADHAERSDRDRDSVKRNILLAKGYSVFTVTGGQICDTRAFDKVVRDIAARLGYRLYGFPQRWEQRRAALRTELFRSMGTYEHALFENRDDIDMRCDEADAWREDARYA